MKKKTQYWHEELLLEDTNTTQGITKVFGIEGVVLYWSPLNSLST